MSILKSKKFLVSVSGVLAVLGSHFLGLSEDDVLKVTGILITYVLSQGLADIGKEAMKSDSED